MIFFVLPQHKCFVLVVGFIIMLKVEGIFETQQSIGLEWRDPRLQVEQELQEKSFRKKIHASWINLEQTVLWMIKQDFWQLYNLRPLRDSNTLLEAEKNQIWIPSVTFVNTATQVLKEIKWDISLCFLWLILCSKLMILLIGKELEGQLIISDCCQECMSSICVLVCIEFLKI